MNRNFILLFLLATIPFAAKGDIQVNDVTYTSLIKLISLPDALEGKRIHVSGYYINGFECSLLYLNKEASEVSNGQEALWINGPLKVPKDHYVALIGTYHHREDFNQFGELDDLTYVGVIKVHP